MNIIGQEKPSLETLVHFGVKGMRWGFKKASTRTSEPEQPRTISSKVRGRAPTKEEKLVGKAVDQGHTRTIAPALTKFVVNAPRRTTSSDPRVEALLNRSFQQAANSVEAQAGRAYIQGLPADFRQ